VKSKVLVMAVALLAVAMLASPVLAAPNANAWRTVPAALATNQAVTYEELTEACLSWGLSGNPYPAPPTPTEEVDPPYVHVTNGSAYYIFTQQIGDDVYEGVSCNVIEMVINLGTMDIDYHSEAIWYLGDWGKKNAKMTHGFAGVVDLDIYGWDEATQTADYYTGTFNLEGFGRFNHRTLMMSVDTRIAPLPSGYCLTLGNRDKM
jgi:hypothetical protein